MECLCSSSYECSGCRAIRWKSVGNDCPVCHVVDGCYSCKSAGKKMVLPPSPEEFWAKKKKDRIWHGTMGTTLLREEEMNNDYQSIREALMDQNLWSSVIMQKPSFPVEKQDKPIRAYKSCNMSLRLNQFTGTFSLQFHAVGITTSITYKAVDVMRCMIRVTTINPDHLTPDKDCTCGFYSFKTTEDASTINGNFFLEVELYGRVLQCSDGYRAQKQRVTAVHPRWFCGQTGCYKPTSRIVIVPDSNNILWLVPTCEEHVQVSGTNYTVVSISDLKSALPSLWVFNSRFYS